MYNKVELPNGFVGLEKEIANLWTCLLYTSRCV